MIGLKPSSLKVNIALSSETFWSINNSVLLVVPPIESRSAQLVLLAMESNSATL